MPRCRWCTSRPRRRGPKPRGFAVPMRCCPRRFRYAGPPRSTPLFTPDLPQREVADADRRQRADDGKAADQRENQAGDGQPVYGTLRGCLDLNVCIQRPLAVRAGNGLAGELVVDLEARAARTGHRYGHGGFREEGCKSRPHTHYSRRYTVCATLSGLGCAAAEADITGGRGRILAQRVAKL